MLHDPAIMLLDEPFTVLDVNGAALLDDLLREWKAAAHTILMTSHDLEHAAGVSDQVLIIHQGKIAVDAPAATIDDLPRLFANVTG
jgi:ABC-2 type transport system ATP-binding protein